MKYVRFNFTNLDVSLPCLGTAQYGTSITKEEAFTQMDRFFELGGNFIDTARVYGDWGSHVKGVSEKIIGEWMESRGCRKNFVVSTKGGHPQLDTMNVSRLTTSDLEYDLNQSLTDLRTDYIDLYFLHRDDVNIPTAQLIEWLEAKKVQGKILHYGCSNWTLDRLIDAQRYALSQGYNGFVCNQVLDSLADVNKEELQKMDMVAADESFWAYHRRTGMNLMAYAALAHGYFSKQEAGMPLSARIKELYDLPQNGKMFDIMRTIELYTTNDFAYQYILQRSYPSVPISSFSSLEQLEASIQSCSKDMPKEIVEKLAAYKASSL